ncbi:MAG: hypothetical protein EBS05_19935 [Proteobacteria bacterium]|nr:hypothetical protein [Pseudomonadota bacterium]
MYNVLGYGLASITGTLDFLHAKPAMIRTLIAERTDPTLFALSYDYVGDLSETVAARMQRVDDQTEKHGKPLAVTRLARHDAGSADVHAVVALLRQPATARQALLASFVLAPPKALEG